jgi:hypothetical protein
VRHLRPERIDELAGLLAQLRSIDALQERTPGHFYFRSRGFLHFHEDDDAIYADVKLDGRAFSRVRVQTQAERSKLMAAVRRAVR